MRNLSIIYAAKMFFPPKGRAYFTQIINTCYALAERGCKVWLLVERTKDTSVKETLELYGLREHQNFKVCQLPCLDADKSSDRPSKIKISLKEVFYIFALFKVFSLIRREKADVIFLRRGLGLAKMLIKLKCLSKVPIVYEAHEIVSMALADLQRWTSEERTPKRKIAKIRRLEEFVYSKVEGLITSTRSLKRLIQEEFHTRTRIVVIHNGVKLDGDGFSVQPDRRKGIWYVGSLAPLKGVDILVLSMAYINGEKLVIVGGNSEDMERLKKLAIENKLEDRITFKGFMLPKETKEHLKRAKVLVLPNRDYLYNRCFTSNIKLFEYMAAATPIVASDLPPLREILKDGKNAILVKPDDPKALAEGIKEVLEDDKLSKRMAENAYEDVKQYTWDKRAERILEFITGLK